MSGSFPDGPGNLAFILGDLWLKVNEHVSLEYLDADVEKMGALCSCFTDDDTQFKTEWASIQADRLKVRPEGNESYVPGREGWEHVDLGFRYRELRALTRAASRNGIISRQQPARSTYTPKQARVEVIP